MFAQGSFSVRLLVEEIIFITMAMTFCADANARNYIIDEDDILDNTMDIDTDPIGLATLSNGSVIFFENESGNAFEDALVLVDPQTRQLEVYANRNQLMSLAPNGAADDLHISDIAVDERDNVFVMVAATDEDLTQVDNYVVMVSPKGDAHLVTDVFDGGIIDNLRVYHRLAVDHNLLYVLFDSLNGKDDFRNEHGANGIYLYDMDFNGMNGSTTQLEMHSSYAHIAASLTPAVRPGQDMGLFQIRVNSAGDLFGVNYEGQNGNLGDVVAINGFDGSASVYLEQHDAEAQTGHKGQFTTDTNLAIDFATDAVYLFETGSAPATRENIYKFDNNGSLVAMVASHESLNATMPRLPKSFTTSGANAMSVANNGAVYSFLTTNSNETLFAVNNEMNNNFTRNTVAAR